MDVAETRDTILSLRFMNALPAGVQEQVVQAFQAVGEPGRMSPGSVLFREGEAGNDEGYVLVSGEIEVSKKSAPPSSAAAPELLGEMQQFNPNATRTATVTAMGELRLMRFKWAELQRELAARLSEPDQDTVTQRLQDYAWEHFTS